MTLADFNGFMSHARRVKLFNCFNILKLLFKDVLIKKLQHDKGGKFQAPNSLLFKNGYGKRILCTYSPTQNREIKRKNRQNIKYGLFVLV